MSLVNKLKILLGLALKLVSAYRTCLNLCFLLLPVLCGKTRAFNEINLVVVDLPTRSKTALLTSSVHNLKAF